MEEAECFLLRTVVAELGPRDPRHVVEALLVRLGLPLHAELGVERVQEALVGDAAEGEEAAVVVPLAFLLTPEGALHRKVALDYLGYPKFVTPMSFLIRISCKTICSSSLLLP